MVSAKYTPGVNSTHTALLIQGFITHCQSKKLSGETVRKYQRLLNKFSILYPELPFSSDVLQSWLDTFTEEKRRRYNAFQTIQAFYNWLYFEYRIDNPMTDISQPTRKSSPDTLELVGKFLQSGISRGLSKETIRFYREILDKYAASNPALPDKPEVIETWIYNFADGEVRRHNAYRAIRTFYNFLEKRFEYNNPVSKLTPPRRKFQEKRSLTLAELKKLLEFPGHSELIRGILYLMADTGIRIGEAHSLTFENVREDTIEVNGKIGLRQVPISAGVRDRLRALGTAGRIWPYSKHNLMEHISSAFKAAGIPGTAHTLRHTFATLFSGTDSALKQIGGWHSWAMVEHYSHNKLGKACEQHREHSPLARLYANKPIAVVSPAPAEEIADLIRNNPAADANNRLSLAKYIFHSWMNNQFESLIETFDLFSKHGYIAEFLKQSLAEAVYYSQDNDKPEFGVLYSEMQGEAGKIWRLVTEQARAMAADHRAKAAMFRELSGEEGNIEDIFLDIKTDFQNFINE